MMIEFNPLTALEDDGVREVWARILAQRFDTEILKHHLGLRGNGTESEVDIHQLSDWQIEHLRSVVELSPLGAAKSFWDHFKFPESRFYGVPPQLLPILEAYVVVKTESTGILLIQDALPFHVTSESVLVADVGCGLNRLGKAILHCVDQEGLANALQWRVCGTDISQRCEASLDARLKFERQEPPTRLPFATETVDMVIVKWVLHHMSPAAAASMASEIARATKPGGCVVIVEAMMGGAELKAAIDAEQRNAKTWPPQQPGTRWFERRQCTTSKYLALSLAQQRLVLALEDYHGHWLDQANTAMPLPFNYMTSERIKALFAEAGLHEREDKRRVFGMAPIIHWGPPSLRLVFEKTSRP
jgi:SAM-dependent methyltransferase